MKSSQASPLSSLRAITGCGALLLLAQCASTPAPGSWGPPKQGVVNVFEPNHASVSANGTLTIYEVPPNRWLTVTAVSVGHTSGWDSLRWSELHNGVLTDKGLAFAFVPGTQDMDAGSLLVTPASAGGTVGWVFHPGSQVVLRNMAPEPRPVSGYSLVGYESRD